MKMQVHPHKLDSFWGWTVNDLTAVAAEGPDWVSGYYDSAKERDDHLDPMTGMSTLLQFKNIGEMASTPSLSALPTIRPSP